MIDRISVVDVRNKHNTPSDKPAEKNPAFGGLGDGIIQAVQYCEKYPMLNVSVLDLSTAIVPRTIVETKEANAHAGFEAFRRESSGLIVNCLIPGFIVLGLAKLMKKPIMGPFNHSDLSGSWANSDSLDKIHKYYTSAKGEGRDKVYNTFKNMFRDIEGVDGDVANCGLKDFAKIYDADKAKFDKYLNELTDEAMKAKPDKSAIKSTVSKIISDTHISEHIKFKDDGGKYFSTAFDSLFNNAVKVTNGIVKENLTSADKIAEYIAKSKKLVKAKSLAGLGVVIPLAISMQPINRWITSKQSGKKGAPIYKDYTESETRELTPDEKKRLLKQKCISIGSMLGVSLLSMMKLPSMRMLEFKGLFPSMDQARIISTATFASRMASSEDRNELREATIRDIATFSSLYFLGDYAAKAIATVIEKCNKDVHLINKLTPIDKNANVFKKFAHWVKDTSIKSSDELRNVKERKLRTLCQIGNIVFSLLALGIFIPELYKAQTNKHREQELLKQKEEAENNNSVNIDDKTVVENFVYDNINKDMYTPFKSFFSSQRMK